MSTRPSRTMVLLVSLLLWGTAAAAASPDAEDVVALLDDLGIRRCRAISASAGAMMPLHLATQHPERREPVVVVGVGTGLPEARRQILATTSVDGLSEAAWQRLRARHRHGDGQIQALYAWVAGLAEDTANMKFTTTAPVTQLLIPSDT